MSTGSGLDRDYRESGVMESVPGRVTTGSRALVFAIESSLQIKTQPTCAGEYRSAIYKVLKPPRFRRLQRGSGQRESLGALQEGEETVGKHPLQVQEPKLIASSDA
jgi:hypothetical protein